MNLNQLFRIFFLVVFIAMGVTISRGDLMAQNKGNNKGQNDEEIAIPDSTVEPSEEVGARMHTNHLIRVMPQKGPPGGGGSGDSINSVETPGSLACIYKTASSLTSNCPTGSSSAPPTGGSSSLPNGGSNTIAIVDAFHYPTAESDLNKFSTQFGLPKTCNYTNNVPPCIHFKQVALGTKQNCGWAQEAALDIEWAHAMAPNANIVLVEAPSNSNADLFNAVQTATNEVLNGGGVGEVSMSWGSSEFSNELSFDSYFQTPGVTYIAASGDSGGKVIYPSASPYVISAGGTSIVRNSGSFSTEKGWSGSGGGASPYEPRPTFQDPILGIVGNQRGTPDYSFDANPYSGVWVYDAMSCQGRSGWMVFGGTSLAAPALAGIINLASTATNFSNTVSGELNRIYGCSSNGTCYSSNNFFDVTAGTAGNFSDASGWDFVTGIGTNRGLLGK